MRAPFLILAGCSLIIASCSDRPICPPPVPTSVTRATARLLDGSVTFRRGDGSGGTAKLPGEACVLTVDGEAQAMSGHLECADLTFGFGLPGLRELDAGLVERGSQQSNIATRACSGTVVSDQRVVLESARGSLEKNGKPTSDYQRVLRVELDPPRSVTGTAGCAMPPTASLTVRLAIAASDFQDTQIESGGGGCK